MEKQEIEKQLREFLGGSLEIVKVITMGTMVDIDVTWLDGRTASDVRRWADANVPGLNNIHLERLYSDATISKALQELYDSDIDLAVMVESYLSQKEL